MISLRVWHSLYQFRDVQGLLLPLYRTLDTTHLRLASHGLELLEVLFSLSAVYPESKHFIHYKLQIQKSQIGGAVVRLLAFPAGDLGSTPQSDYKRIALVT